MLRHLALIRIAYYLCLLPPFIKGFTCSSKDCPLSEPKYGYPDNRFDPYPFPTPIPVALETKYAYPICRPKMQIKINKNALLLVNNTGEEVKFVPYFEGQRVATATGGIVGNYTYSFKEISYSADGVPENTRTGDTLNGVPYPIKFWAYFVNDAYGSNYSNHRDGLLRFGCPMIVEAYVDNPSFTPTQKALYEVSAAYSTTTMRVKDVLPLVLEPLLSSPWYYSYPGAQFPNHQYFIYSVLDIFPSFSRYQTISYDQYKTFGHVHNKYNQSQYPGAALHELRPRPFVQVRNSKFCVDFVSHL